MGRLHCTQDPVPEAVGGDMQQLNQLGVQQFSALTEVLFHFLTEPKEVERFMAQLSEFATTNQISLGPLRSIVKSLLLVPNGLSEEKATYFSEKWKQNAPTLARWAIGQTLMINQLIDMEWKFGVTSGSSELEKLPARDGARQSQHGVFQLTSVPPPPHLHLALSPATSSPVGDGSEKHLTRRPVGP
ncbi:COMM domain-containing protein 7 isoform 7-T7 [Glossophaga mutica]